MPLRPFSRFLRAFFLAATLAWALPSAAARTVLVFGDSLSDAGYFAVAFTQRRQRDRKDREPVHEVLAQVAFLHRLPGIAASKLGCQVAEIRPNSPLAVAFSESAKASEPDPASDKAYAPTVSRVSIGRDLDF